MTLLRPTYFYNWNNHTQKDSLYIETGPWFTAKKGRFMIHGQACSILRVITFKLLVGVTEQVFLTVCRISIFWGRTYVHGNKASVESLWKHWDLWHVVEDLPCNSLIPGICGCNPTLLIFIIYIYVCIYIYLCVCVDILWIVLRWSPHCWLVNIGLGNSVVPSGNKSLPELVFSNFSNFYDVISRHQATMS